MRLSTYVLRGPLHNSSTFPNVHSLEEYAEDHGSLMKQVNDPYDRTREGDGMRQVGEPVLGSATSGFRHLRATIEPAQRSSDQIVRISVEHEY